ncbi:MAG: hypothetical protein U9Q98_05010, partial [Bacteroidota bacterium]|nr:hypothetical protein [Bacteroidota bacterium]
FSILIAVWYQRQLTGLRLQAALVRRLLPPVDRSFHPVALPQQYQQRLTAGRLYGSVLPQKKSLHPKNISFRN